MMDVKKIIGTSAVIMTASVWAISTVFAGVSDPDQFLTDTETNQTTNMDTINTIQDPYEKCLTYVKFKNLSGIDCKAKAEAMRQENKENRTQMNQEIRTNRAEMQKENKENRQQLMENGIVRTPGVPGGELAPFFKNPLSTEEKTTLKTLMSTHMTARESIMKDSSLTMKERVTKLTTLMTQYFTDLLPYVASDKQDDFKEVTTKMLAMIAKNTQNRQEFNAETKEKKQELKEQVKAKKQALSDKLRVQLTSIVEKLPVEKLNKVLANVEKAVVKIQASALTQEKKDRLLAQLAEIKTVVQAQIDTLSGNNPEVNLLNEVLNGVNDGSTSTTVTQ